MKGVLLALLLATSALGAETPDAGVPVPGPSASGRVYFRGDTDEDTLKPVLDQLKGAKGEVTLVITSPGGSVISSLLFVQEVEELRRGGLVVHCVADIFVASAAALILESPACTDRAATVRATIMFHGVQAAPSPLARAVDMALASVIAPRLGLTVTAYLAKIAAGDWILTASEAVAAHAVDKIVD